MKRLSTLLQYKYICIFIVICSVSYSLVLSNLIKHTSKYDINDKNIVGYIHRFNIDGNRLSLDIVGKEKIKAIYYFKKEEEIKLFKEKYNLGDYVLLNGIMSIPKKQTVFNLFDYKRYLFLNKIHYVFYIDEIVMYKKNDNILYKIKQKIINRIDNIYLSKEYLYAFILGDNSYINKTVRNTYQVNGISHLFAISGLHISFIVAFMMIIFKKLKYKYLFIFLFIYIYMFLTNFSSSILRAGLFFILLSLNKILKLNVSPIYILLLTLSILLILNPFLIYSVGLHFSFLISMYLILSQDIIKRCKTKIITCFVVSLIAFFSSVPIVLYNFYQINLLSVLLNLFFVPFVSFIIFPLSLLCFVIPFFDGILYFFINILESGSSFFCKLDQFILILGKPNIIFIILYYLIFTLVIYKIKSKNYIYMVLIPIIMIVNYYVITINKNPEIIFIDVGQGDAILIRLPFNKGNILVDTGGVYKRVNEGWEIRNNTFSLGEDVIVPYLKSEAISKIDYLIITHGHYDHMGEAINIINNIKVEKVIMNKGDINYNERRLINYLYNKNIEYKFKGENDKFVVNNTPFFILNPHKQSDENTDSIVIYTKLNNKKILLTGDATIEVEEYIINKYDIEVDILKVGHHGSKTSTGDSFINYINLEYAVILVGKNNKFNHPHPCVLETLKNNNVKIYRTDIEGSIKFIFNKKDVTILTTGT